MAAAAVPEVGFLLGAATGCDGAIYIEEAQGRGRRLEKEIPASPDGAGPEAEETRAGCEGQTSSQGNKVVKRKATEVDG
jgi:hypothetical protein